MAAYAATVTPVSQHVLKLPNGVAVLFGTVNITNYNQTLAEVTGITGLFKPGSYVVIGGVSSNGFVTEWDTTGKAFKARGGGTASASALTEAANDTNVGVVDFVAIGLVP